jgi:WD40 repeat protein
LIQLRNRNLVSGSVDKTIKIWDIETCECIQTLTGHNDWINDLKELENGNIISESK